eukprot:395416-Prymnesium_polylepis.1
MCTNYSRNEPVARYSDIESRAASRALVALSKPPRNQPSRACRASSSCTAWWPCCTRSCCRTRSGRRSTPT